MKLMYNFVADPSNHSHASAAKCSVRICLKLELRCMYFLEIRELGKQYARAQL
jgi:hypothetical protein